MSFGGVEFLLRFLGPEAHKTYNEQKYFARLSDPYAGTSLKRREAHWDKNQ